MRIDIVAIGKNYLNDIEMVLKQCSLPTVGLEEQLHNFYVAKYGSHIVGAIGIEIYSQYGLLRSCCVLPNFRNEQIGTLLTQKVIQHAHDRNLKEIYLLTETGRDFFSRFGFKPILRDYLPSQVQQSAIISKASCCSKATVMVLEISSSKTITHDNPEKEIIESVKNKYTGSAREFVSINNSCCGSSPKKTFVTKDLYDNLPEGIPEDALLASLGCGNPLYLAQIKEGETVLDLGCGGGLDVLLSAKRVGPLGKVYGIDMTDDMLELARSNQRKAGIQNVDFLKGQIEAIPLPASSVDLIISNCVINLSPNKDKVFAEAYRILKPNGRLAISDIVFLKKIPANIKKNMELWAGCISGALEKTEYLAKLQQVGFANTEIETTRIYNLSDFEKYNGFNELTWDEKKSLDMAMTASFVRAVKQESLQ